MNKIYAHIACKFRSLLNLMVDDRLFKFTFNRFLIVGVANLFVGMSVIYLAVVKFDIGHAFGNFLGYAVGVLLSYFLNAKYTFKYTGSTYRAFPKFVLVFAAAYALNIAVVLGIIRINVIDSYLAHWIGMPIYTIVFYLGSKYLAFRDKRMNEVAS